MTTKPLKQSETRIIRRSQISLNPYNPKRHTEERIKQQKKNLQKIGYLGGITWNERTGNLIDGHRRIQAMDLYYKYDGTPDQDYPVKVEVVNLDEKQEKEQMTYMALGNTRTDLELVAKYLPDIDVSMAGIDDEYLKELSIFASVGNEIPAIDSFALDDFLPNSQQGREQQNIATIDAGRKAAVKASKAAVKEASEIRVLNEMAYITLSFSSFQSKAEFCELAGIAPESSFAKGEEVLAMIE
ncbi:ParB N-terminal domain-containing protein [Millionella massiliensis]|uniref:ParB N-terminal domain-containing protein n=1 Tax=Millionella massiliensis TaxID=1871023 RepID=UPI0008DAD314|nr:ParB N-terminal domain-containing protein [Millionella massiliensis]